MGNGVSPPRPLKSVPRVFAYHSRLLPSPLSLRVAWSRTRQLAFGCPSEQLTGPFHILLIADASVAARQLLLLTPGAQSNALASKSHSRGSVRTPSTTPSSASQ